MKDLIKKIVRHYEEHRESYKTWNEDEMASVIYESFSPEFKNLCLPDVIKSVCVAPKGECDRKPEDVCKECKDCKYLEQTVL